jgi:hypothetical protein
MPKSAAAVAVAATVRMVEQVGLVVVAAAVHRDREVVMVVRLQ